MFSASRSSSPAVNGLILPIAAAVGKTKGSMVQVNLTANTDMRSVDDFKRLVIREDKGAIVRIEDVGQVEVVADHEVSRLVVVWE